MRWQSALVVAALAALLTAVSAPPPQTLYQSMFVVSGTSPERRVAGFEGALRRLMVKLSGDRSLADNKTVAKMIEHAADYVVDFSYLDLKFGIKLSDEQGSYDRPQYLTVTFDQAKIDKALKGLHRKVWATRPTLVIFLAVHRDPQSYVVNADDARDAAMRESAGNASLLYSVPIAFPPEAAVAASLPTFAAALRANPADLDAVAKASGGDAALVGTLDWSDADHGWIADWTIAGDRGRPVHWQKKGISFDDAFRDGLSGAALALSGNGTP
ncbi:MAG: DUF2066 domain-containing protein [Bauldia sp.]